MPLQDGHIIKQLQAENDRLRQELAQCNKQHEHAASELWDANERLERMIETLLGQKK